MRNSLSELLAAWLDGSQKGRDGVQLNKSAREYNINRFDLSLGLDTVLCKNGPFHYKWKTCVPHG